MLKNAYRATIERHWQLYGPSTLRDIPPVQVTVASPGKEWPSGRLPHLSIRIRDEGGGVTRPDLSHVFSYAFTTAGRNSSHGDEMDGGPYSAQHVGGSAAISRGIGENSTGASRAGLFAEMTGKGIQTGVGTLAGLGYGLPMSRLYAKYFGGSLDLMTMDGWGMSFLLRLCDNTDCNLQGLMQSSSFAVSVRKARKTSPYRILSAIYDLYMCIWLRGWSTKVQNHSFCFAMHSQKRKNKNSRDREVSPTKSRLILTRLSSTTTSVTCPSPRFPMLQYPSVLFSPIHTP